MLSNNFAVTSNLKEGVEKKINEVLYSAIKEYDKPFLCDDNWQNIRQKVAQKIENSIKKNAIQNSYLKKYSQKIELSSWFPTFISDSKILRNMLLKQLKDKVFIDKDFKYEYLKGTLSYITVAGLKLQGMITNPETGERFYPTFLVSKSKLYSLAEEYVNLLTDFFYEYNFYVTDEYISFSGNQELFQKLKKSPMNFFNVLTSYKEEFRLLEFNIKDIYYDNNGVFRSKNELVYINQFANIFYSSVKFQKKYIKFEVKN